MKKPFCTRTGIESQEFMRLRGKMENARHRPPLANHSRCRKIHFVTFLNPAADYT